MTLHLPSLSARRRALPSKHPVKQGLSNVSPLLKEMRSQRLQKSYFEASQIIKTKLALQIEQINESSTALFQWQSSLTSSIEELQPVLSIIRNALTQSQADMHLNDADAKESGADLSEQDYKKVSDFFKKNPQIIYGFSGGSFCQFFPSQSTGADKYRYTETDLVYLNAALQNANDLFSDQINGLQILFQIMTQSYAANLDLNINYLDFAHATMKSLIAQFA